MPSDIIGVSGLRQGATATFRFTCPGRSSTTSSSPTRSTAPRPRTQSALLEAMSETSASPYDGRDARAAAAVHGRSATQNPYEFEGTYFLPENQLDRFLMRINLGYPAPDDEARIIRQQPARTTLRELEPVMSVEEIADLQTQVDAVRMDDALVDYVIALSSATRDNDDLQVGISPAAPSPSPRPRGRPPCSRTATTASRRTSSPTCFPCAPTASSARATCTPATPRRPAAWSSRCWRRCRARRDRAARAPWTPG